jgi:RNA polymerase sigma-70 factor (TIGR02957 family)
MPDDTWSEHRSLLFTIAYEMLGSVADAEDVLQESYIRWSAVDHATVEHPRAYLVRLVTRQALNQMRTVKARREEYVGTWLPEPVRTGPDVGDDAVLAESVSMAMMLVLETLNPVERAVFVLHEVFGYGHAEIAASVGRSEVAVRQIAHRAREHVQARRRRFEPDSESARSVVRRFLNAARSGEVRQLMELMSPDVVTFSDGGGKVTAARRPITGHAEVAKFAVGVARGGSAIADFEFAAYNGLPAVRFLTPNALDWLLAFEIHDGLVTGLYGVRNPDKLSHADQARPLTRGGNPWKPSR